MTATTTELLALTSVVHESARLLCVLMPMLKCMPTWLGLNLTTEKEKKEKNKAPLHLCIPFEVT